VLGIIRGKKERLARPSQLPAALFTLFLDRVPGKIVVVVGNIFDCSNRRSKVQNRPAPMEKSIYKTRQGCTYVTICGVENITIGGKAGLNIR
jgi:hypothetical protein